MNTQGEILNLDSEAGGIVIPSRVDLTEPKMEEIPRRNVPEMEQETVPETEIIQPHIPEYKPYYRQFKKPKTNEPPPASHSSLRTNDPLNDIACITISQHVESCPICSRFYNPSTTIYIVTIVGLLIICMYLINKAIH